MRAAGQACAPEMLQNCTTMASAGGSEAFESRTQQGAPATPRWSLVLRALREASGASQEGWAAQLGFGRSTVQRWESGNLPPGPDAETALLKLCAERRLLRTFYQGPLRGQTVTEESARLGSSSVYSTVMGGRKVTAVGEVPPATVRSIASSFSSQGPTPVNGPHH